MKNKYSFRKITLILVLVFAIHATSYTLHVFAATNISPNVTEHWGWNDLVTWIDFYNTNSITVSSQGLTGYASSSIGDISLDCATTRIGNICGQSNYRVLNDGNGNLSGWGWNDLYGWISFYCGNTGGCGQSSYQVFIDGNTGDFSGWAWNDVMGWLSFCGGQGTSSCPGSVSYKVKTNWMATSVSGYVDSSVFDTGISGGSGLHSIVWQGSLPVGTSVQFQIATSNSSAGPWIFVGPDGTVNTYYSSSPDTSLVLDYAVHNNKWYFRYRVTLISNQAQTLSPRVDRITVHWAP